LQEAPGRRAFGHDSGQRLFQFMGNGAYRGPKVHQLVVAFALQHLVHASKMRFALHEHRLVMPPFGEERGQNERTERHE
jgi:hypothetical protein